MVKTIYIVLLLNITLYSQFNVYLNKTFPLNTNHISALAFSKDGRFFASGDAQGRIVVYDNDTKRRLHYFSEHKKMVTGLIFDRNNKYLVSCSLDENIIIWDLYSGSLTKKIDSFDDDIYHIALSPDDKILAAGGDKDEIFLWELPSGQRRGVLFGHSDDVLYVTFNSNGDQLLSVGKDEQMIVWDPSQAKFIRKTQIESQTLKNSDVNVQSAQASFDKYFVGIGIEETKLAKGGRSMLFKHNLAFFDWETGSEIEILQGNLDAIKTFVITPDKQYAITDNSSLRHNKISFWNIQKGIIVKNYDINGRTSAICVSENGEWLAVAFTKDNNLMKSAINLFQLSGIDGFKRFDTKSKLKQSSSSSFGSSIKLTTPEEPLIQFGVKKKIAVLYFDSPGLDENIAKTSVYLLEGKLGNSQSIDLIERNQINKVLDELKYQMSGLTASDAVEVGKQLNAEFILIGSINKLGSLLIITVKVVNVATAKIEGSREVQCTNSTIENIPDMISLLASSIVRF